MNIEIDIDGLHCDGKLVMVWADASDLVARDKLIAEFDMPELPDGRTKRIKRTDFGSRRPGMGS